MMNILRVRSLSNYSQEAFREKENISKTNKTGGISGLEPFKGKSKQDS